MSTFHALSKYSKIIFLWGILFVVVTGVVSMVWPKQYSATSQVLIISRDRTGIDPYTQAKSAERIGDNLAQVMKTTDFYQKVFESTAINFDRTRWQNLDDRHQRKQWQKDVKASMVYNSGLMNVTVYSPTANDTIALSQAVLDTVVTRGWEYVGGDVTLKVVSTPLASRFPTRPNILLNVLLSFILGVLVSGLWVVRYRHPMFS